MNAKKELLKMFKDIKKNIDDVTAIRIGVTDKNYDFKTILKTDNLTEKDLDLLDFEYDDGYGLQELDGLVLFKDNTWLERYEYDGGEWWGYNRPPTVNEVLTSKHESFTDISGV